MIDVSYLIANLDEILGDNMFLKDACKAENLKGSIYSVFSEVETRLEALECDINTVTCQTFSTVEELNKFQDALKSYLKNQIDLNRQLLSNLGEWY